MATVHGDNYWLAQIARDVPVLADGKTIAFDGTDGLGKILTKATDTVTADTITDGDTVTIGGQTYTFQDSLVDSADNVAIGGSDAAALDNLKSAINASAGAGTAYGTGTVANASVTATTNTNTTQVVEALTAGAAGNDIAVSSSGATLTWDSATLTGGADGTIDLFTATGNSLVALIVVCSEDLAGATATFEIGVSGATAKFIPQTTATNFDNGESADITGIVSAGTALVTTPNQALLDGQTIILTPGTADITDGTITVYAYYKGLNVSSESTVDKV